MPATQCLQSLLNGERCKAPAVNGTLFCRHHDPQREIEYERKLEKRRTEPFLLPDFDDKRGLFLAIKSVLQALSDRKIKRSEADTYLHGLKMAGKLLTEFEESAFSGFLPTLFNTMTEDSEEDEEDARPVPLHRQPQPIATPHREHHAPNRAPSDQVLARLAAARGLTYVPGEGAPDRLYQQLKAQDAARAAAELPGAKLEARG